MRKNAEIKPNHKYAQSNQLVTAKLDRNITVTGQKLIRLALTNIDSVKDDELYEYTIKMKDFAELMGLPNTKNIYRECKKVCLSIAQTVIGFEDNRKKNNSFTYMPLFSACGYDDGNGMVVIQFNDKIKPFLLHLKGNFTQIPLQDILLMSHKYSIRVYELIKLKLRSATPHADKHYPIEISVDELRRVTDTENKYPQIKDLKTRVLYPALSDIERDETAQIHCNVKDIKEGRTIIGFKLDCWSKVGWNVKGNHMQGQGTFEPDENQELHVYY